MRIADTVKVALAVVGLGCEGAPTAPSTPTTGDLIPSDAAFLSGDRVEIEVRLQGCFHDHRIVASLRIDGDSAIVENFEGTGTLAPDYRYQPVASLSAAQLVGLGQLLEEYRGRSAGGCTSTQRGRVQVFREGEAPRTQEFDDSTCRWPDEGEPAFYWFMLADVVQVADGAD